MVASGAGPRRRRHTSRAARCATRFRGAALRTAPGAPRASRDDARPMPGHRAGCGAGRQILRRGAVERRRQRVRAGTWLTGAVGRGGSPGIHPNRLARSRNSRRQALGGPHGARCFKQRVGVTTIGAGFKEHRNEHRARVGHQLRLVRGRFASASSPPIRAAGRCPHRSLTSATIRPPWRSARRSAISEDRP